MLDFLNHLPTVQATNAERALLGLVEGGCQVPLGVHATVADDKVHIEAVIAALDGSSVLRDSVDGPAKEAVSLGRELGRRLLTNGGQKILDAIL